jgi:hypothetical protein
VTGASYYPDASQTACVSLVYSLTSSISVDQALYYFGDTLENKGHAVVAIRSSIFGPPAGVYLCGASGQSGLARGYLTIRYAPE